MQKAALALFCLGLSVFFVFTGAITALFAAVDFYWVGPALLALYGLANIFLTLAALTDDNPGIPRFATYLSVVAAADLIVMWLFFGPKGQESAWTLFWCLVVFFNWLAIRKLAELRAPPSEPDTRDGPTTISD